MDNSNDSFNAEDFNVEEFVKSWDEIDWSQFDLSQDDSDETVSSSDCSDAEDLTDRLHSFLEGYYDRSPLQRSLYCCSPGEDDPVGEDIIIDVVSNQLSVVKWERERNLFLDLNHGRQYGLIETLSLYEKIPLEPLLAYYHVTTQIDLVNAIQKAFSGEDAFERIEAFLKEKSIPFESRKKTILF